MRILILCKISESYTKFATMENDDQKSCRQYSYIPGIGKVGWIGVWDLKSKSRSRSATDNYSSQSSELKAARDAGLRRIYDAMRLTVRKLGQDLDPLEERDLSKLYKPSALGLGLQASLSFPNFSNIPLPSNSNANSESSLREPEPSFQLIEEKLPVDSIEGTKASISFPQNPGKEAIKGVTVSLFRPLRTGSCEDQNSNLQRAGSTSNPSKAQAFSPKAASSSASSATPEITILSLSFGSEVAKISECESFLTLKSFFPWLKELEISTSEKIVGVKDFHGILEHFPALTRLRVERLNEFGDVGIMGSLPAGVFRTLNRKGYEALEKRGEVGLPLHHLANLRSLILRGELDFTDVGFIKAFKGMESLHELELTGSLLHVSKIGLHFLARNCPDLRRLSFALSNHTVTKEEVNGFIGMLKQLESDFCHIRFLKEKTVTFRSKRE